MDGDLQQQLTLATAAARDAYRDTTRLIRLLSVLGQSTEPEQLLDQTLTAVADVFGTDVAALTRLAGDRLVVAGASGLAEDDPVWQDGWLLTEAARAALRTGEVVNRSGDDLPGLPASVGPLGMRSAAWIPLPGQPAGEDLLILLRQDPDPFTRSELKMLGSVASRLRLAVQERERSVVVERLARSGHRLSRHLELEPLLDEAAEQLRQLTAADETWVVMIDGEVARLHAHRGLTEDHLAGWPRPAAAVDEWRQPPAPRPAVEADGAAPSEAAGRAAVRGDSRWGTAAASGDPDSRAAVRCSASLLRVPVLRDGELVSVMFAQRARRRPFASDVPEVAAIFANYLSVALVNVDLYRTLHRRASHDPLTGLANRTLVGQQLDALLSGDADTQVGLLFCDLDRFKAVNDYHGHEAGDDLLQQVAERLRGSVRPNDLLARFGGDEFVIVLRPVRNLAEVSQVAERVCRALDREFIVSGERVPVSASVGGVIGVAGQTTGSLMLRHADAAMYAAKERGLGQVCVFDEAASHRALDRLDLRAEVAHALERAELEVRYQPIVSLATGSVVAFEALLRWHHPRHGTVTPEVFIPLAEDTGAIVPIGEWVLEQACRQLAAWRRLPPGEQLAISVNVSATQLRKHYAPQQLLAVIRGARLAPRDVWLEVTEYGDVCAEAAARAAVLQAAGARFALDDFGTAYAGLSHLQQFPIEFIKIDMSFVRGIAERGKDHAIVRAVLTLAESMGLTAVAEGIETTGQLAALRELGCPLGQGRLLAEPLPAERATEFLLRHCERPVARSA